MSKFIVLSNFSRSTAFFLLSAFIEAILTDVEMLLQV